MDDAKKIEEMSVRLGKQQDLIAALEVDRDEWKALALLTSESERKLVALRETIREALENSE